LIQIYPLCLEYFRIKRRGEGGYAWCMTSQPR
jgi:hypothetical protein